MSTGTRAAWLFAALLGASGCERKSPLAEAYVGTVRERARVQQDTGPKKPDGSVPVAWWTTDRPQSNVRVRVKPAGEQRYRIELLGCTVEVEMDAPPNDHAGRVVARPQQFCPIAVDHYDGVLFVTGTVTVDPATKFLSVHVGASNRDPSPHVEWSLSFEGRASAE